MIVGPMLATPVLAAISTVYPAYATAKTVTAKETEGLARWCQYWLIFSILSLVTFAVDYVGSFLPFYWEARIAFAFWLVADKFKGATFLCEKYLQPFLATHQSTIDAQIAFVMARVKDLRVEDVRAMAEWAQSQYSGQKAPAPKAVASPGKKAPEQADKPQEPEEVEVIDEQDKEEKKEQ